MALGDIVDALKDIVKDDPNLDSPLQADGQGENSPLPSETDDRQYFYVEDTFLSKDVIVAIEGIGKLTFPLTKDVLKNINAVSTKAKFGRGEETLLDTNIRDTQMIPANKLKVEINEHALASALERISTGLNISDNSTLVPHLFNMLIYGPGQFFKMHRDSEKLKNMVATLVIILPSPHKGGDLIIQHNNKKHIFFGSRNPDFIKCIVFYSDCQHEIKKVTEGFRVALTYNVVLNSPEIADMAVLNECLNTAVHSYFSSSSQPRRLIFLLNHSYSQHSLKWNLLKGTDRSYAFSLYAVAKSQNRVPCLALADYTETHDVHDDYRLLDSSTELYYWVNECGIEFEENVHADYKEICYTMETTELFESYKTEDSGPTGNAGETQDHWYRRGCVVLWSNNCMFWHGFKIALHDLHSLSTESGNENRLIEEINKIGSAFYQRDFWIETGVTDMLLDIAIYLKGNKIAVTILSKLPQGILKENQMGRFLRIEEQYDEEIWKNIFKSWKKKSVWFQIVSNGLNFIDEYIKITNYASHSIVIEFLLKQVVSRFIKENQSVKTQSQTYFRFSSYHNNTSGVYVYGRTCDGTIEKLCKLLKTCANLGKVSLENKLIQYMISTPLVYTPVSLAETFFKLQEMLSPAHLIRYKSFKESVLSMVVKQILELKTNLNDWYWPVNILCQCEYCTQVQQFFLSKTSTEVKIKTAKANRAHIYRHLNPMVDQPIRFFTERTGSPFKIIIVKDPKLIKDRKTLFSDLSKLHEKLQGVTFLNPEPSQFEILPSFEMNDVLPSNDDTPSDLAETQTDGEHTECDVPAKRKKNWLSVKSFYGR